MVYFCHESGKRFTDVFHVNFVHWYVQFWANFDSFFLNVCLFNLFLWFFLLLFAIVWVWIKCIIFLSPLFFGIIILNSYRWSCLWSTGDVLELHLSCEVIHTGGSATQGCLSAANHLRFNKRGYILYSIYRWGVYDTQEISLTQFHAHLRFFNFTRIARFYWILLLKRFFLLS